MTTPATTTTLADDLDTVLGFAAQGIGDCEDHETNEEDGSHGQAESCPYFESLERAKAAVPGLLRDAAALDRLVALLAGREWSSDDFDRIAEIIESTGRPIADVDGG